VCRSEGSGADLLVLGRGINFGGALDRDAEGTWLRELHFDVVQQAGFDTVRLPVKWSGGARFERVDWAVERALRRGLNVVLDVHHFDELSADVDRHAAAFLALWSRIAERYEGADKRLCFELLNEPHDPMTAERWNALLPDALAVVCSSHPERSILVGPVRWNIADAVEHRRCGGTSPMRCPRWCCPTTSG
jgi:endoglucanase